MGDDILSANTYSLDPKQAILGDFKEGTENCII